jgi:hypothetical protein
MDFAHTAGDELGVLRAEIENCEGVHELHHSSINADKFITETGWRRNKASDKIGDDL